MSGRDDLREQIAAALYEAEARRLGYGSPLPDCVDPRRWLDSADALLPLVGAQVEAARRDGWDDGYEAGCADARRETRQP